MKSEDIKTCPACGNPFKCWQDQINFCFCKNITLSKNQQNELAKIYSDCLCPNCLSKVADRYQKSRQEGSNILYRYPIAYFTTSDRKVSASIMIPSTPPPYPIVVSLHQSSLTKFEWFQRNNAVFGGNFTDALLAAGFSVISPQLNPVTDDISYDESDRLELISTVISQVSELSFINQKKIGVICSGDAIHLGQKTVAAIPTIRFLVSCFSDPIQEKTEIKIPQLCIRQQNTSDSKNPVDTDEISVGQDISEKIKYIPQAISWILNRQF